MTSHVRSRASIGEKWILALVWSLSATVFANPAKVAHSQPSDVSNITRIEHGDTFSFRGAECLKRECGGRGESLSCNCACPVHAPLFREDTGECVDDITECSIAPFGTGSSAQRIPYVFLPLKGQIIHPSKEISFPGVKTPICAVSGAQFLTRNGFIDLRNSIDSDVPFALFRDEGRTFLQWTGESEIRSRMEGRLLVVHLLCRDVGAGLVGGPRGLHGVFTPCAAFRIAGSPARHISNVSEVLFSPDARSSDDTSTPGLTVSEYVAIGISSVLLGLIYVASIFLYLHIKKRRSQRAECPESPKKKISKPRTIIKEEHHQLNRSPSKININDDGVIKNNPLLGIGRHFHQKESNEFDTDSGSIPTDEAEESTDDISGDSPDDVKKSNIQNNLTVHPIIHNDHNRKHYSRSRQDELMQLREDSGFERLPEENVSIVETFDFRDEKPENVKSIGTVRKKLYFNPAYFEPHLLMSPPPAAVEFLVKIREVISIAKHKMESKRFTPSLIGIPEEEACFSFENNFYQIGSQRSSAVSLKRENQRRRPHCSGCPGCEAMNSQHISNYLNETRAIGPCHSCSLAKGVNKQSSIRKWLEGVPILNSTNQHTSETRMITDRSTSSGKCMLNAMLSLPRENHEPPRRYYDYSTRSLYAEDNTDNFIFKKKSSSVKSEPSKSINKYSMPLPSFTNIPPRRHDSERTIGKIVDISPVAPITKDSRKSPPKEKIESIQLAKKNSLRHSMPDMINEALVIDKSRFTNGKGISFKQSSDEEKSNEEREKESIEKLNNIIEKPKHLFDYETDSLERTQNRGLCTPSDYADISSSQPSPSLSTALPMDEELTMRNAIYKLNNSRPQSRVSQKEVKVKHNDYEVVDQNQKSPKFGGSFDNQIYNFTQVNRQPGHDYSLVTEVYVNNGYNFGSTPTSPSESDYSTFGKRRTIIKGPEELPGHLTIEVKDPPENYIQVHESDGFEPDTLDRKPTKIKINISSTTERSFVLSPLPETNIADIKPVGVFDNTKVVKDTKSHSNFSSLREMYEKKSTKNDFQSLNCPTPKSVDSRDYEIIENINFDTEEGRILTLEQRHCKRQRQCTPPELKGHIPIPPDVIPPLLPEDRMPIYEYPKPPRKVSKENLGPPLPPKNESGRSPSSRITKCTDDTANAVTITTTGLARSPSGASVHSNRSSDYELIDPMEIVEDKKLQQPKPTTKINFRELQTPRAGKKLRNSFSSRKSSKKSWRRASQHKEDSGYLSTDSNESRRLNGNKSSNKAKTSGKMSGTDTDGSDDAQSESGAESVETHSVFFGSLRKVSLIAGSVDSGTGSDLRLCEVHQSELENCQRSPDSAESNFNRKFDLKATQVTQVNS